MTKSAVLLETAGWLGMAAVVGAYLLLTAGKLSPSGATYQGVNLAGSIALVAVCAYKRAWQPCALNVIWSCIALAGLVRLALPAT